MRIRVAVLVRRLEQLQSELSRLASMSSGRIRLELSESRLVNDQPALGLLADALGPTRTAHRIDDVMILGQHQLVSAARLRHLRARREVKRLQGADRIRVEAKLI